jgi:hypothetical protein
MDRRIFSQCARQDAESFTIWRGWGVRESLSGGAKICVLYACFEAQNCDVSCGCVRFPDLMYILLNKLIAAMSPAGIEPTFKVRKPEIPLRRSFSLPSLCQNRCENHRVPSESSTLVRWRNVRTGGPSKALPSLTPTLEAAA